MSMLSTIFSRDKPMTQANNYLDQIPGKAHGTYDPYITQGQTSGANAHSAYEDMLNDPQGFINKMMGGYKESDAYKYQAGKLGSAMSNTAAAGGIAGTPLDQQNQGEALQGLLSADQQQYLQNVLGRYDTGLKGEAGEATRGYDASGKLNDIETSNLNQQGGLAFNNAQQNNKNKNDALKEALHTIMALFGKPMGGGGQDAGPMSGTTNAPWANPG